MVRGALVGSLVCVALVAGCGGGGASRVQGPAKAPPAIPSPSEQGLLARGGDEAAFIAWTRIDAFVVGTLYTSSPQPRAVRFTGSVRGAIVTLTPRSGDNWNGTFDQPGVTLSTVESNGLLRTFVFRPARGSDYGAAVRRVRTKTSRERVLAAEARHGTPTQRRLLADKAAVDRGVQDLENVLAAARSDSLSIPNLLAVERREAEKTSRARQNRAPACTRASDLGEAAETVRADAEAISVADTTFALASKSVTAASASLRSALERARADERTWPGVEPIVDSAAVRSLLANVTATMQALRRSTGSDIARAAALRARASAEAAQALRACHGR